MAIQKRDQFRLYSFMRPFVIQTVQRFLREGQFSAEDLPAGELVLAGQANPLPHGETHELFAVDELRVDNVSTLCVNRTGVTIPIHSVVFVDDVGFDDDTGQSRPAIDLADSTDSAKLPPFGLTREEILNDGEGLVVRLGRVEGFDADTPGFLTPETLYLDPATPGGLTNVAPPTGTVYRIATVLADESSFAEAEGQGELLIAIENLTDIVGGGPSLIFTKSGIFFHGGDDDVVIWRAPFPCTVTNVRGYRAGGSAATINARRNGTDEHLSSDLSLPTADLWTDGGAVQNTAYVAGDKLEFRRKSATGKPAITVQVDFIKL